MSGAQRLRSQRTLLVTVIVCGCADANGTADNVSGAASSSAAGSWDPIVALSPPNASAHLSFNFARTIAADDRGDVHVVWSDDRDGVSRIYYRRSANGGRSWQADRSLSDGAAAGAPSIALAGSDVYVAWQQQEPSGVHIFFRRSPNVGATWDPLHRISSSSNSGYPSLAAQDSQVHIAWMEAALDGTEVRIRSSRDRGNNWAAEQQLSDSPYASWVPAVAATGSLLLVAWVDYQDGNEEEYVRRSLDGGRTWLPALRLTHDEADSWAPSVAIGTDQTIHLSWFDRRAAGLTDSDVERALHDVARLIGVDLPAIPPRSAAEYYLPLFEARIRDGVQRIQEAIPAWVSRGGDPKHVEEVLSQFQQHMQRWASGWEIFYKQSADGGATWTSDTRLTNAPGPSARPSLAVADDHVHVVWFDERDGNSEIYYKQSSDGGRNWGPDVRLTTSAGPSTKPSLAAGSGAVHAVWMEESGGESRIYYSRRRAR